MIEETKILREPLPYCIHLSKIKERRNDQLEHHNSITDHVQTIFIGEKPAKPGLFSKDLQSLVSKLEILRSFSVSTPDTVLAEQIGEAMLNEQENIDKDIANINHELMQNANLILA